MKKSKIKKDQKNRIFISWEYWEKVLIKNNKGKKIIKDLFISIKKKPSKFLTKEQLKHDKQRAIADFISGMTDRFAINLHKNTQWIFLNYI